VTIYGIPNCETMKKARAWLSWHGVEHLFHDYKNDGIDRERLETWCTKVGWETLLNRAGTTFRKLSEKDKQALDARKALALMLVQPSLIKRPNGRRPFVEGDGNLAWSRRYPGGYWLIPFERPIACHKRQYCSPVVPSRRPLVRWW
jgi:arsenate reductase